MIAKRNGFGSSYYAPFRLWDALAAGTTSTDLRASNEGHLCWGESLSDMLGSMSEFLMLATSRSPAQWMTLAIARESADDASVAPRRAGTSAGQAHSRRSPNQCEASGLTLHRGDLPPEPLTIATHSLALITR